MEPIRLHLPGYMIAKLGSTFAMAILSDRQLGLAQDENQPRVFMWNNGTKDPSYETCFQQQETPVNPESALGSWAWYEQTYCLDDSVSVLERPDGDADKVCCVL
jgi:hypothetical protein